jgi:hypothetical protein
MSSAVGVGGYMSQVILVVGNFVGHSDAVADLSVEVSVERIER